MEKELIKSLFSAIANIDGGCPSCIREFIKDGNLKFYEHGIIYTYEDDNLNYKEVKPKAEILEAIKKYEELRSVDISYIENPSTFYNVQNIINLEFYDDIDF